MLREIGFYFVIFLTNIIQGITGFAGTVLAMTPSIFLVGYEVAKPVLNALGLLAGLLIMFKNLKDVRWKELRLIIPLMLAGIAVGILVKPVFAGNMKPLYILFGIFVLALAIKGLFIKKDLGKPGEKAEKAKNISLLVAAGIIHGLFVSGGPLLVEYAAKKIEDKQAFRATLSAIWVVLNTIILVDDIRYGYWTGPTLCKFGISVPSFLLAIYIGGILAKKMSREFFLKLTYVLMAFSGFMMFFK